MDVLDLFKISSIRGSAFGFSEGCRLAINEQVLNDHLSNPVDAPMPKLGGFHFSRPPPVSVALSCQLFKFKDLL